MKITGNISGTITNKKSISGATVSAGGGTNDHTRLTNRDADDQHPISAITDLQSILDSKLDSETALPLIDEAIKEKAKGLYYGPTSEFPNKSYWYLTSEIDQATGQGTLASIISGPYDLGSGGGGGGGGVTEVTILNTNPETGEALWPGAVSLDAKTTIGIYWTSTRAGSPTGAGTMYLYINDNLVSKKAVKQGQIDYDITEYLVSGENKIEFKVTDAYSTSANIIGNVTGVSLKLTSAFEDDVSYTGDITYTYTPIGDISKTVHFIVDNVEVGQDIVKTTGEQCTHILKAMSHGAHTLQVYFVATLDGQEVNSNILKYDLITYESGNYTPIIASTFDAESEQEQYVSFNIPYRVYTPGKNTSVVYLYVNGVQEGEPLTCDITWHTWEYRPVTIGQYIFKIQTGSVSRSFNVHVSESSIDVQPVTANLVLELNSIGRSNSESATERIKWQDKDHDINCSLSGFNWSSNGWVQDDDSNTVLRLSGDARVTIPYQPFAKDLQQSGKTIEIEFATTDVKKYESRILECLTGGDSLTYHYTYAGEDDRPKIFIVTDVDSSKFIAKVKETHGTYIFLYDGTAWTLDGETVDLEDGNDYGIAIQKVDREEGEGDYFVAGDRITVAYEVVGRGLYVTPQLAKFQSQLSSLSTQYKENEHVRLAFVVEKRTENRLIYMYINGIMSGVTRYPSGDTFEQNPASNIVLGSNDATLDIYQIRVYDNSLTRKQIVNNWIADMRDPVTKAVYYQDNDNFDETGKIVISKLPSKTPYMTLTTPTLPSYKGDKKDVDVEFVYPGDDERYFTSTAASANVQGTSSQYYYRKNFKIKFQNGFTDIEGETEKKYKIVPPLAKKEKTFTFKADVASSEGANNVELVRYFEKTKNFLTPAEQDQDPDDTASGYLTKDRIRVGIDGFPIVMFHNNGASTNFYGKMNFNNDKSNDDTFGFTDGDECWEFINNTTPLVLFQTDDMSSWDSSFESRYPEEAGSDEHAYGTGAGELDKLTEVVKWIHSTQRLDTDSDDEKAAKLKKFRSELTKYFNLNSSLFYYLYTELFLMVDSRAKNAMLAYLRSHQSGDGGGKWYWMPYDMDTGIGTNNEGLLVFDYDAEDTDIVDGAYVYNGQQSVFWNNLRDAFPSELKALYANLRSGNAGGDESWSYDNIENLFEEHQSKWSASIFNEDSYTKYLEPLVLNNDATYLGMAQGSKEQQRKWWLYNRFKYLDSKYRTGDAADKNIMLRAYKRDNLVITPYINCYVTGVFDQAIDSMMVTVDAEKDTAYTIVPPEIWDPKTTDSVVIIYSADLLKDIGDLSGLKPGYADFSAATKLQRLQIGSSDPSYSNDKLDTLNVGNNHLLTYIDARNCTGLGTGTTKTVDLSNCTSIEEAYFDNTNVQGVSFPVGGNLKVAHLPATITDLTIRSHPNLSDLTLYGTSNLTSIWLEDIPSSAINAISIVSQMKEGSNVRLININESVSDVSIIKGFYDQLDLMKGKDAKGDTVAKAQVTGKIAVNTISYSDYIELSARYPEISITAKYIVCTVNFWNEGVLYDSQSVNQGSAALTPTEPTKPSTQKNYWTFNSWDKDFSNVQEDMDINAIYDEHIQVYTITFHPESQAIVTPDHEDIEYGSLAYLPELSNIPEGVNFLGWFYEDGSQFNFESDVILNHLDLHAKWYDPNSPEVKISRKTFDTFSYEGTDNVGITAYAITRTDEEPASWIDIEPAVDFKGEYQIDDSGYWFIWVKDAQDNKVYALIHAEKITYTNEEGADEFALYEGESKIGGYALNRTEATLKATLDSHYENMSLTANGASCSAGESFILTENMEFVMMADRKKYQVAFDIGTEHGEPVESQTITYLNYATEPDPQYDESFIITGWYSDEALESKFDFKATPITGDITLHAKWEEYHEPTKLDIVTESENQGVTIAMELSLNGSAQVDFGDGSSREEVVIDPTDGYAYAKHTYATAGSYSVLIYLMKGQYYLGKNDSVPAISPISILRNIEFAWDVTRTNNYAFQSATNLEKLTLTDYMTSIAVGAFKDCTSLKNLSINKNIVSVGAFSFQGCSNIEDAVIVDNKIKEVGEYAFDGCSKIPAVKVNNDGCSFGTYCFRNCVSISEVPSSITRFSDGIFQGCVGITSVDLSEKVEALEGRAFMNCSNLEKVIIRNKDMQFTGDGYNFSGCLKLETAGPIPQKESDPEYDIEFAFDEEIPDNAFSTYSSSTDSSLTSIQLPSSLKRIGARAFAGGTKLSAISIPETVEEIGHDAFSSCSTLRDITIPENVYTIGNSILVGCTGIRNVYLYTSAVDNDSKISDYLQSWFYGMRGTCVVHIPSVLDDYSKAQAAYGLYWNYINSANTLTYTNDLN